MEYQDRFNPIALGAKIKRVRESKKLSIEQVAEMSKLNKNTVVRLEKGNGSAPKTIYSICDALDVHPLRLMESELEPNVDYKIVKRVERAERQVIVEGKDYLIGDLQYRLPGGVLNAAVLEIKRESEWRSHAGEEFLFCLSGTVGIRLGKNVEYILDKGDTVFFWGTEPHQYFNNDRQKDVSIALSSWCDPEVKIEREVRDFGQLYGLNEGKHSTQTAEDHRLL